MIFAEFAFVLERTFLLSWKEKDWFWKPKVWTFLFNNRLD